jgi:hypothetical protein
MCCIFPVPTLFPYVKEIFGRNPSFFAVVLLGSYPTLTSAYIGRLYLFHYTEKRKAKSEVRNSL